MTSKLTDISSSQLSALWPILPTRSQTLLLQSCLGSPAVVTSSWSRWSRTVRNPRRFIRRDARGVKSILPLLHDSLRRIDLPLDKDLRTLLRTASFRERLRLAAIHRICRAVLQTLAAKNIHPLLSGDLAVAESAYPDPSLRHCGGIHLLIVEEDISPAIDCLCSPDCNSRFKLIRRVSQTRDLYALFVDESGLEITITSSMCHTPHYCDTFADLRSRACPQLIDNSTIRIPCSADLLLAAIDQALIHGSWKSLSWICDACMLVRRFGPSDWDSLLVIAVPNHLACTSLAVLLYLSKSLQCRIPQSVLGNLRLACEKNPKTYKDVVTFCARSAARSDLIQALRHAPDVGKFCCVISQAIRIPLGKIRRALR